MTKRCPYCGAPVASPASFGAAPVDLTCPACGNRFTTTQPITQILRPDESPVAVADPDKRREALRLYTLAGKDLEKKRFNVAITRLTAAADLDPSRVDTLLALAGACSHQNMVYEALTAYKRALAVEPNNTIALLRSGMLLVQRKAYAEATATLERLLAVEPENPQASLMLSIARNKRSEERATGETARRAGPTPAPAERLSAQLERTRGGVAALGVWLIPAPLFALAYPSVVAGGAVPSWFVAGLFLYVVFFSVTFHELGHGLAATLLGDETPVVFGRMTFNPLAHLSPVGSALVPALVYWFTGFMFGWARPVPFEPMALARHPRDVALVAGAGPAASLFLSFAAFLAFLVAAAGFNQTHPGEAVTLAALVGEAPPVIAGADGGVWFTALMTAAVAVVVNLLVAVFNLIPIPPLDGGWLLRSVVPATLAVRLDRLAFVGALLIGGAVYFDLIGYLFYPVRLGLLFYYFLAGVVLT
jgi:Zn-dependent protease